MKYYPHVVSYQNSETNLARVTKRLLAAFFILSLTFQPLAIVYAQEMQEHIEEVPIIGDVGLGNGANITPDIDNLNPAQADVGLPLEVLPEHNPNDVLDGTPALDVVELPIEDNVDVAPPGDGMLSMESFSTSDYFDDGREVRDKKNVSSADVRTGAFTHVVSISVPPGRNGTEPNIKLIYSSQDDKVAGIYGGGWSDTIPYIKRTNKRGIESMYNTYDFTSMLDGELATTSALSTSDFAARIDGGTMRSYTFSDNMWVVEDKDGNIYTFGSSNSGRQDDPNDSSRVYKWMLESVVDVNGNGVYYEYYKNSGEIYPSKISYVEDGGSSFLHEIVFQRESRNDDGTMYSTGFGVSRQYRISTIEVKVDGDILKEYQLNYATGDNNTRSLLSQIDTVAFDTTYTETERLTKNFSYSTSSRGWEEDSNWTIPVPFNGSSYSIDPGVRLEDVNGDGFVDILQSNSTVGDVYLNRGDGTGWDFSSGMTVPASFKVVSASDPGTRFADVNGDGYTDVLRSNNGYTEVNKVWINNGDETGWTEDVDYEIPALISSWDHDQYGVRIVDVNGDGLPDVVQSPNYAGYDNVTYMNQGNVNGWIEYASTTVPVAFNGSSYYIDSGVRIIEVNGDGLPDLLHSYKISGVVYDDVYIHKGDGTGWFNDTNYSIPAYFRVDSGDDPGVRFADVNGDGLTDVLQSNNGYLVVNKVWINQGDGTGWVEDTSWEIPALISSWNHDQYGVRIVDVNGDGLPDVVQSPYYTGYDDMVYINKGDVADLLINIEDEEGLVTTVDYQTAQLYTDTTGNLLNPSIPLIVNTVKSITRDGGFGNIATTTYSYFGGNYYFASSTDRKFAGFASTTETDDLGNVTTHYYHQANGNDAVSGESGDSYEKIGKEYRTEIYDDSDNLYKTIITGWNSDSLGGNRYLVTPDQIVTIDFDGDGDHKDSAQTFEYDTSTGNLTQTTKWGEVSANTTTGAFTDSGSDLASTTITYVSSSTSSLIRPSQELTHDYYANKVSETKHYYDNLSFGNIGKGNETKTEQWVSGSTYIDTERTYNSYGLITQIKDPRDKATSYSYDSYNLYPTTVTNPLSHVQQFEYDYLYGKVATTTDENSRVFVKVYDGLGRVVEVKQPDITTPSTLVTNTTYTYTDTLGSRKIQKSTYLDASNIVDEYTYLDGFDRPIQTRREAENSNIYAVSDTQYDELGRVKKQSLPYFSAGSSRTTSTSTSALFSTFTYDPLDRVHTKTNAAGTATNTYDQWKETVNDLEGNNKHYYSDAFGRLVRVDEVNGVSTYTTEYEYDTLGNLTKITDAEDNVRNFTYNALGNRLTAQDLHDTADSYYGTWTYVYDDAGNVTQMVDPKSQTINYTYDDINRVLTEDYTGDTGTEIVYTYDSCSNGVGQVCSVTTSDVVTQYTYNPLRLADTETRTINGVAYATEYDYDRQGNVTKITYPDDSEVTYTFNMGGLLESVSQKESGATTQYIISDFDYSPAGQVTYKEFGNDVNSTYTYALNELYRLKNINTIVGLQSSTTTIDATTTVETAYEATTTVATSTPESASSTASIRILIVGGGGGGKGDPRAGGGGGGGGVIEHLSYTIEPMEYPVTVAGAVAAATNGSSSAFDGQVALGGGKGGGRYTPGDDGGSGGGGGSRATTGGTGSQGYNGGRGSNGDQGGGGGGGAGANGSGGWASQGNSNGGTGYLSDITGVSTYYAGGGGGGVTYTGPVSSGGAGGGGGGNQGTSNDWFPAVSGTNGLGGGGGGSIRGASGGGGSGVVIIAYKANGSDGISASSTGGTITTSGEYQIHTFLSSSTFVPDVVMVEATTIVATTTVATTTIVTTFESSTTTATTTEVVTDIATTTVVTTSIATSTRATSTVVTVDMATTTIVTIDIATTTTVVEAGTGEELLFIDLQNITFIYDDVGNIVQIGNDSDTVARATTTYGYDDLYRLTSASTTIATTTPYSRTYTYNSIGNITNKSDIGSYLYQGDTGVLHANPHAVTSVGGDTYTYDNNGNLTSDSLWSYTWDYRNRLVQSTNATATTTYEYDHAGNRVSYTVGTTTTYYPNKYYSIEGGAITKHVFAGSDLVATVKADGTSTTTNFIHADHLGGTSVVTDESGDVVQVVDYYPYGALRVDEQYGSFDEKRKYIGQEYDEATELSYLNARYYEGNRAQFLSQDPVFWEIGQTKDGKAVLTNPQAQNSGRTMGRLNSTSGYGLSGNTVAGGNSMSGWSEYLTDPQGQNSYSYARNNPLRYTDPNGEWYKDFITGQQSWSSFYGEVGEAANTLGQSSTAWNFAMNHPYTTGAVVGVASAGAAQAGLYGTVAMKAAAYPGVGLGYSASRVAQGTAYLYLAQDSLRSISGTLTQLNNLSNPTLGSSANLMYNMGLQGASTFGGESVGGIADTLNLFSSALRDLSKALSSLSSQDKK